VSPGELANVEEQMRWTSGGRISIPEIADRLSVGRMAVYQLLENRTIPAIRRGRRWIVTRHAYEQWEKTCGTSGAQHILLAGVYCESRHSKNIGPAKPLIFKAMAGGLS
jgi:excisionase family DNA binding protein